MIRIDTDKIEKWEEIKGNHKDWWIKHLKSFDIKESFGPLNDEEKKLLIKILNDFKEYNLADFEEDIESKKVYEILNCKEFILNDELSENLKEMNKEWFQVNKKIELSKEYKDFISNYLLKKKEESDFRGKIKNDRKGIQWENHLKKATTAEEKEFIFYLLKQEELTSDEKGDILKLSNKEQVQGFLENFSINSNFIKMNKGDSKKELEKLTEYQSIINVILKRQTELEKLAEKIFDYKKFSSKKEEKDAKWGRHKLLTMMGIEVCPYCQRNYISKYKDKENEELEELTTADLDHFYPKSEFPFLALSLYNFIPSCQICNRTFKLDKSSYEKDILYPYKEGFDDEDFNVKFKTSDFILENDNVDFKIEFDYEKENKRVKNTIDMFKLDKVYETSHNGYIKDMIYNVRKYPESYTKKLSDIFGDNIKEDEKEKYKKILDDNFQEIIKKPYKDRIEKGEPLAKLTKDIMDELGIKL